mgnify:CR=1 FL=1
MPTFVVLLGPPGAGKGTQAKLVAERMGLPHISSGDIFRENLQAQTELGRLAKGYIDRGELVPDDVTIAMIRQRLSRSDCAPGAVLDGFPRTTAQAQALEQLLNELGAGVDAVIYIKVPEPVLIERLSGRWTCRAAGHIFHEKYNPPRQDRRCDYDGSELYQREDDRAETVAHRISVYLEQTAPLVAYYQRKGLLVEVDGAQPIEKVTEALLATLPKGA